MTVSLFYLSAHFSCPVLSPQAKEELKMENQRLKDENGALIRVITKLSKWDGTQDGEKTRGGWRGYTKSHIYIYTLFSILSHK